MSAPTKSTPPSSPMPAPLPSPPLVPRAGEPRVGWYPEGEDLRRTAIVGLGTVLAFSPLFVIFNDWRWFIEGVGAALCVVLPALLLRRRTPARTVQLLPGLVLLVVYATALYLKDYAVGGLIPGPHAWDQLLVIRRTSARQISESVSPLHSTAELRTFVVPGLGVFVALVDWYAVVRRAPALAGVPLLALFTVCGAIAGTTVGWIPFTAAAAGFLLILSADSRLSLLAWGRVVPRRTGDRTARARLGLSGRRIGVIAVILAVLVPAVLPGLSRNLLADSFHGHNGSGDGDGTSISPFAKLKGDLTQGKPITLAQVQVDPGAKPYFLRSKVLDEFTGSGWKASSGFNGSDPSPGALAQALPLGGSMVSYTARVEISQLKDVAPIFGAPSAFVGLNSAWQYSFSTATLGDRKTQSGETYTERVVAPAPTASELAESPAAPAELAPLTALPPTFPTVVRDQVTSLTADAKTPYKRAIALYDFFKDPAQNFVYSLSTKAGDSGSDLVDFLQARSGYCQQYAAALAVMFRAAGIPARVVLGYTHPAPDAQGKFTITSRDAHAWVEGYFAGFGWLPFNPTPLVGNNAARNAEVPYAPAPSTSASSTTGNSAAASGSNPSLNRAPTEARDTESAAAGAGSGTNAPPLPRWAVLMLVAAVVVLALALLLPGVRVAGRRSRFRSALHTGSLEPLWAELRASAVDSGAAWSGSTTPRQVPDWLRHRGVPVGNGIDALAGQVERERYAPTTGATPVERRDRPAISDAIERVLAAARAMRNQLTWAGRLRARLLPASVTARWRGRQNLGND